MAGWVILIRNVDDVDRFVRNCVYNKSMQIVVVAKYLIAAGLTDAQVGSC
jgi:hypothetical protein